MIIIRYKTNVDNEIGTGLKGIAKTNGLQTHNNAVIKEIFAKFLILFDEFTSLL